MIKFKTVSSKNFYAIGNQPLKINLESNENTLVVGGNGSGKTSALVESLVYGLYGKPYRKVNLDGIINSINKNNCLIEVVFEKAGVEYKVIRGEKPKKFEIYKDGELIPKPASNKDYQAELELILGMDYRIFSQVVVLNKSKFVPFMDLSATDRRFVVEEFLDINIISKMLDVTRKKIKDIQNEIKNKEQDSALLSKDIDKVESLILLAESKNDRNKSELADKLNDLEIELVALNAKMDAANKRKQECVEEYEEAAKCYDKNKEIEYQTKSRETGNKISILQNDIKRYKADAMFFKENDDCPTCAQGLSPEFKDECLVKIKADAVDASNKIKQLTAEQEEYNNQLSGISVIKDKIRNLQQVVSQADNELQLSKRDVDNLKRNISNIQSELDENEDGDEIEENTQALKKLKDSKKIIDVRRQELYTTFEHLKTAEGLFKEGGIKADIVRQYLPVINKKVNEYLGLMNLPANFYLDEEFNESVKIPGKEKFVYYNFSDGQRTRIDLAMLMTWVFIAKEKNSINTNLLILDEILEALDINGIHDFLNTIKYTFDVNLFVISQRGDELADCFKNQLKFELKDNFTTLH